MGDSGGALLAGIGCVVERLGVGAAIPSGYTASSASVAAPGWHHAQPSGEYHALICRRAQRRAVDRAVTGAIRAAASNDLHGAQRHRVYLVGQGAAHVSVGASRQVERTHGPDRTQERDRQGRDAHHRSIRAHRGHCARARSPSLPGLPPRPRSPALFPRARGRVSSVLVNLAQVRPPCSRAWTASRSGVPPRLLIGSFESHRRRRRTTPLGRPPPPTTTRRIPMCRGRLVSTAALFARRA